jgi:hypothetical protein
VRLVRRRLTLVGCTGSFIPCNLPVYPGTFLFADDRRFNGVGGFDPNRTGAMIDRVFECAEPCVWNGQNKVLFKRMLRLRQQPD